MKGYGRKAKAILLAVAVALTAAMLTACVEFPPYTGDEVDRPGLEVTEYRPIEEANGVTVPAGMTLCYGGICTEAFAQEISITPGLLVSMRRNKGKQDLTGLNQKDYTGGVFSTLYRKNHTYLYTIKNTSDSPITMTVTTTPSQALALGDTVVSTKTYNTYSTFLAPETAMYDVTLTGWTSALNAVALYGDDAQAAYTLTEQNDAAAKRYRVFVRKGQELFLQLRTGAAGSVNVNVKPHESEYVWYENGTPLRDGILRLRRNGEASGPLTLKHGSDDLVGSLVVSGTDISCEEQTVTVAKRTQISIASSYFGYAQWKGTDGALNPERLVVEILPETAPALYAMQTVSSKCLFGIKDIDAQAHGTEQETVSIVLEITNGKKTVEQTLTTTEGELIYQAPAGIWDNGTRITLRIKAVRYAISGREVTYTASDYPEIVTGESITLVKD